MSDRDNPYGSASSAGKYQMSYQQDQRDAPAPQASGAIDIGGSPRQETAAVIKDISTAEFVSQVIEASRSMPVVIDFWAPWCQPCKQLSPILEKVAAEFGGQAKLVKMDIEKYPEISGQMGIQSIPAVVAFVDGKPVDAFMGVKPESEIRSFFEKHAGPSQGIDSAKLLTMVREAIANDDLSTAMDILTSFLQVEPDHPEALALTGSIQLKNDNVEDAENIFASIAQDHHGKPEVAALKAELELIKQAGDVGEIEQLLQLVEAEPDNIQAKFDLSLAYNIEGNREQAADRLLEIIKTNRQWNDDGARKQLVKYFEAWGEVDEATKLGRRKLSTLLFS